MSPPIKTSPEVFSPFVKRQDRLGGYKLEKFVGTKTHLAIQKLFFLSDL